MKTEVCRKIFRYYEKLRENSALFYYLLSEFISKLIPLINTFLFLNFLNVEDFGFLSNINVIYATSALLISNSLHTYYISQYYELSKSRRGIVIRSGILISFLIWIILFFVGVSFLKIYSEYSFKNLIFLIFILSASYINSFSRLFFNHLRINSEPFKYFFYTLIFNLILLTITFTLLYLFKLKIEARVYSIFFANIVLLLGGMHVLRKYLFGKIFFSEFRKTFFFGLKLIPHNLSFFLRDGAYKFLITTYIGLVYNAYFSLILYHVFIVQSFNVAFFNYYSPILIKKISLKKITITLFKKELFYYFAMISLASIIAGIFLYIYVFYFKLDYHPMLTLIKYIVFYSIFYCVCSFTSVLFFVKNKPQSISAITFYTSLFAILTSFLFFKFEIKKVEIILIIMTLSAVIQFYLSYKKGLKLLSNDN